MSNNNKPAAAPTTAAEVVKDGDALTVANAAAVNEEDTDLVKSLRAEIASLKIENETAVASAASEVERLKQENASLKSAMTTGNVIPDDEGNFTLRVKSPMIVNPGHDDVVGEGEAPRSSYSLVKGLNVGVPKWVAESWVVKNNLEDE